MEGTDASDVYKAEEKYGILLEAFMRDGRLSLFHIKEQVIYNYNTKLQRHIMNPMYVENQQFLEHATYGTSCLPLAFLNLTI